MALAESRLASLEQQNSLEDRVRINGFISFAMERTSNNVKNASGDPLNYRGVDDSWDTRRLSRAGVQFNARIDDRTEAVVQLLARGDAANDYNVDAQWAYIAYDINPDLTARAGRLVLPFYLHSQYFQAGYAYPWIELPAEVYGRIPKETHEGIDLVWRTGTGPVSHNVNLFWGSMDVEGINGVYEVRNQTGLNIRSQWQNWTSFIGYTFSDVSLPLPDQSGAGFYDFSPLSLDEAYAYFATAGIQYDNGRLLVMAETTQLGINSEENWFPKTPSRYLTVGYRFGQWMPHLTWAQSEARGKNCPQTLASAACVLYSDVGYRQKSWTLGTRYELTPGVALKAEASRYYDFSNDSINTSGYFENPALPLLIDPPVNDNPLVFRIAVEAVF
ncbi:MAG: hypothetical protein CVV10_07945 [Gammaproteobacteria bacterium HGW-Gammaproteobacteria-14]|nr:MAG: hypothetical protein CVV10_07945 [Gammaproteobacteria bacterium HGW-Gammaproteobacteria-14]